MKQGLLTVSMCLVYENLKDKVVTLLLVGSVGVAGLRAAQDTASRDKIAVGYTFQGLDDLGGDSRADGTDLEIDAGDFEVYFRLGVVGVLGAIGNRFFHT